MKATIYILKGATPGQLGYVFRINPQGTQEGLAGFWRELPRVCAPRVQYERVGSHGLAHAGLPSGDVPDWHIDIDLSKLATPVVRTSVSSTTLSLGERGGKRQHLTWWQHTKHILSDIVVRSRGAARPPWPIYVEGADAT